MPTYKRIDGDYNITTLNSDDDVIITTNTVKVIGNLDVAGNLTYINVTELNIRDPFILLNASNTGSYAANSGVLVHITSTDFAGIRYNDNSGQWEVSSNTTASGETGTWTQIATGNTSVGGANTEVQFNDGGAFGGDPSFTFDKITSRVAIDGTLALVDQGTVPSPVAATSLLYSNVPSGGGSGVYFVYGSTADELVSKTKAIVYSIIF